jgi:outer membrane receptor for Fe3+-dicitrate
MDIRQYQLDREQDFQAFKTQYDDLKARYISSLTQAVYDSSKVQDVLDANKSLVTLVTEFIAESQDKFDTKTIEDLTQQIILYQQEYQKIKDSREKSKTLIEILNKENSRLEYIQTEFNTYLWILFGCIVFLIFLIFRVPSVKLPEVPDLQLSTTIPEYS